MVNLFYEDVGVLELTPEFFVSWLSQVCESHKNTLGEISLIFCSDKYLLEMNQNYLNHDYYTDIITFNYCEKDVAGDLFISLDRVKENAKNRNIDFIQELYRVVVHGVLHLIGFNDSNDIEKSEMRALETKALSLIVSRET